MVFFSGQRPDIVSEDARASLQRLLIGWGLGATFGVLVGFAIGLSSLARSSMLPLVSAIFPIPKIALRQLFIVWLGIGEVSKVATIAYFTVRITLNSGEISKLAGLKLVPGMPAEVHVRTGDRTILSYLMKSLQDQFTLAFKER